MGFTAAQKKSLAIGFGLILAAAALVVLIWLGTYLPGFAGELFSVVAGLMWTPIVLDLSIFLFGVVLVLWLNRFIRAREGDEYVYLEQVEGPEVPGDLPRAARSAVFREEPSARGLEPTLAAVEGALDLEDFQEATTLLLSIPSSELNRPEVLALRIRLAEHHGDAGQVAALRRELDQAPRRPSES